MTETRIYTIDEIAEAVDDDSKTLTDHVGVGLNCKVVGVDDVKQTFQVFLDIHCHYKLPARIAEMDDVKRVVGPREDSEDRFVIAENFPFFTPEISVNNCVDLQFEQFQKTVRTNKRTGYIWVQYKNLCTIHEDLNLRTFPYDRQIFKIEINTNGVGAIPWHLRVKESDYSPALTPAPGNHVGISFDAKNWKYRDSRTDILWFVPLYMGEEVDKDAFLEEQDYKTYDMQVMLICDRDHSYYEYNYILVSAFLVFGTASVFLIAANNVEDRQALTITILLAMVALKFALSANTPVIGYNTRLDKLLLIWYTLLFVVLVWNYSVASYILGACDNDIFDEICIIDEALNIRDIENVITYVFIGVWFVILVVLISSSLWKEDVATTIKDVVAKEKLENQRLKATKGVNEDKVEVAVD